MSGLSPTQRTLRFLRQQGALCGIVERWNPHVGPYGVRQDLFGFIDIIAVFPEGICAIQSCGQSYRDHQRKIVENEAAREWLRSNGRIQLYGWRKVLEKRGGKRRIWRPRVCSFRLDEAGEEIVIQEHSGL